MWLEPVQSSHSKAEDDSCAEAQIVLPAVDSIGEQCEQIIGLNEAIGHAGGEVHIKTSSHGYGEAVDTSRWRDAGCIKATVRVCTADQHRAKGCKASPGSLVGIPRTYEVSDHDKVLPGGHDVPIVERLKLANEAEGWLDVIGHGRGSAVHVKATALGRWSIGMEEVVAEASFPFVRGRGLRESNRKKSSKDDERDGERDLHSFFS